MKLRIVCLVVITLVFATLAVAQDTVAKVKAAEAASEACPERSRRAVNRPFCANLLPFHAFAHLMM